MTRRARPKAVLFDWDNTLVDTWPIIVECYRDTFVALGRDPWTSDEVKARAHGSLRDLFPALFGGEAVRAEQVFYETFHRIHLERLAPLPGAAAVVERLAGEGLLVGVVSNKVGDNLRTEVAHLGWSRWLNPVIGARDARRDKPAPDPILMALAGSGIAPAECWMVGDTPADLASAKAAGCQRVLVGGPDRLPDSFVEYEPLLRARDCHGLMALLWE